MILATSALRGPRPGPHDFGLVSCAPLMGARGGRPAPPDISSAMGGRKAPTGRGFSGNDAATESLSACRYVEGGTITTDEVLSSSVPEAVPKSAPPSASRSASLASVINHISSSWSSCPVDSPSSTISHASALPSTPPSTAPPAPALTAATRLAAPSSLVSTNSQLFARTRSMGQTPPLEQERVDVREPTSTGQASASSRSNTSLVAVILVASLVMVLALTPPSSVQGPG
eukprot:CAMPEP_0119483664 /NCGR_PEP_ID=MMETSP1344-20130328/10965_1 /TAXON_ID=236787 /ORGANISM="Florenciella parvula, Strain CCMP2471" /LENGTH=229 /DNA_ID=CAMNT_0007518173 /DNA_START=560 /DNA_END=1250 /DNA_ORIENTATION=+